MKLFFVHAPERCAPCRDMGERMVRVQRRHPELFADAPIVTVHADQQPELVAKLGGVSVIPAFVLADDMGQEIYRAEGRISEVLLEQLVRAVSDGRYNPQEFSIHAPSAGPVFFRTYSRRTESDQRETFREAIHRVVGDIAELGKFTKQQHDLVLEQALGQHTLPSGRWLWVGGTDWIKTPANFSGAYNCTSTNVDSPEAFGLMMELAMMGSGTGAVLEDTLVAKLPPVAVEVHVTKVVPIGSKAGQEDTTVEGKDSSGSVRLVVGDSRNGWVQAYQQLIDWAMDGLLAGLLQEGNKKRLNVVVDLSNVRPAGERLKGFGGTANPVKLGEMFQKVAKLLSSAKGRQLTPLECCLLIDEASAAVVAGNIRRSAGMRQFSWENAEAGEAKDNLYTQDKDGNWRVDPVRENLRMANHTRVAHRKPSLEEIRASVLKQFHSGEGAIQYAPEAIARSNADLLTEADDRAAFLELYEEGHGRDMLCALLDVEAPDMDKAEKDRELDHRLGRYGLNPCGEILGQDFHCNLAEVHLNTIDPKDLHAQEMAFRAAGLQVAALLHHRFAHDRYSYSRNLDPIVGVSFTGLFDFFVHALGEPWLAWMMAGRPEGPEGEALVEKERKYLTLWRRVVRHEIVNYCTAHGLRVPNRCTTVQPAGTKSLLTGASSGWHPPKAQRFIRRITFGAYDPVALAAIDYGYNVIPAQSARDDEGNLLDDIYDERSREWLVEIPTEVNWASVPGCDQHDLSQLSARAQFGLYMQVQRHYTEHNTSATIEFRESEIDELSELIHGAMDEGYISAALLARFDANATFPRLPFEPIDRDTYWKLQGEIEARRTDANFHRALARHDRPDVELRGAAGCDSDKCLATAAERDQDQVGAAI